MGDERSEEDLQFLQQFEDEADAVVYGENGEEVGDHRGAFGEYGADALGGDAGFLDQSFRERIVLVGVTVDGQSAEDTKASLDELELL
ncbi:MAG: hypothetical protein AAF531_20370, partial [Actinomycetota bacterium]